ncbi:MAG: dTDP-Rha--alpha-D-GlcNAc-pyrophosphate polyprenol alpha-3-L-rhamnosyltransferase [Gammaproteobacteria bacterium HGW-Gammaproteobacteria-8]|nr:MAG: dTDP-Rha--alpha-D-GlcNAc-pyrophosphate polyprenol alpha-3-L-rhamnosyltransferase [Gammaproteobacteria bacterium HGW-Gammaproteobacteria-8]
MSTPDTAALARVGVLIVNYNSGSWLARAIRSVRPDEASDPEIIVVDNGSVDGSADTLDPRVRLDRAGRNLGFAGGINRAAALCERELLLLLNPDCLITPEALDRLVAELDAHPEAALVSGRVVGEDGREQRASRRRLPRPRRIVGEVLPMSSNGIDLSRTSAPGSSIQIEAVSGACMLVRAAALRAVGGLDEGYPLHFEDLDLFARLGEAGWTLRWVPEVEIVHAGGKSSASRPLGVEIDKHRGLWRYLSRHCRDQWPAWQRPLWGLALLAHLLLRLAMKLPGALLPRGKVAR